MSKPKVMPQDYIDFLIASPVPVTATEVKAIRDANPGRMMFFTTDELLKLHPMK